MLVGRTKRNIIIARKWASSNPGQFRCRGTCPDIALGGQLRRVPATSAVRLSGGRTIGTNQHTLYPAKNAAEMCGCNFAQAPAAHLHSAPHQSYEKCTALHNQRESKHTAATGRKSGNEGN